MDSPPYIVYSILGIAEPLSALSHLFAAGVFGVLGYLLIRRVRSNRSRSRTILLFTASAVALLLISGIYHMFPRDFAAREVFQRLDRAVIFVFIASTFTPIHTILFEGAWRWAMLMWIWILAAIGIFASLIFMNSIPESVCLSFYLGLGWLGLISGALLWSRFGFRFIIPLLLGSLAYTSGAISDFVRAPVLLNGVIGPHELFHLSVLLGIGFHWRFISSFAHKTVQRCPETRKFALSLMPK